MNANCQKNILNQLDQNQPIFTAFPVATNPTIIGLETELGSNVVELHKENFPSLPRWFKNGGYGYIDVFHLEVSTPEVSNPVSAVIYNEAMLQIAETELRHEMTELLHMKKPLELYANNVAGANTFGSHESYSTSLPRSEWKKLAPYLVARTLISGAGYIDRRDIFSMSQRAGFIEKLSSPETQQLRGIICLRQYFKEDTKRSDRFHLICGESNLNQVATFLKVAFTTLLLELAEKEELPILHFDEWDLLEDLKRISQSTSNWISVRRKKREVDWEMRSLQINLTALDVLWSLHERFSRFFGGRDFITDAFLAIFSDSLEKLQDFENNSEKLARRLDWATKVWFYRLLKDSPGFLGKCSLADYDLEYHHLNNGLQSYLEENHCVEVLVAPELIVQATTKPPFDTRASFRGWLVDILDRHGLEKGLSLEPIQNKLMRWQFCQIMRRRKPYLSPFEIADPFTTYWHLRPLVAKIL